MRKEINLKKENYEVIEDEELYYICKKNDINEGDVLSITFEDGNEAFAIKKYNKIYGYTNECPHNHIRRLHEGIITKNILKCPMHGWSFEIKTGKCLNKSISILKKYIFKEINNKVYIKKPRDEKPIWMLD